jgi:hypothetical protein
MSLCNPGIAIAIPSNSSCTRGTGVDIFGATYAFDVIMSCCDVSTDARPPAANRLLLDWSACGKQSVTRQINTFTEYMCISVCVNICCRACNATLL